MGYIKALIFNWEFVSIASFILAIVLIYAKMYNINLKSTVSERSKKFVLYRLRRDEEVHRRREQLEKIGVIQKGYKKKYYDLINNILISLKLEWLSVENFTTILIALGILFAFIFTFIFNSIFLGILVSIPSMFAIVALMISITKASVRANDDRVMDSEDLICPTIGSSVTTAIKNNLHAIDPKIRRHYQEFIINIETRGMLFREAMVVLNKKLGPRFDSFAQKAILFHDTGDEGMSDIFRDIVENNNLIRSINMKADRVFKEKNFDMIMSAFFVVAFLAYAYVGPLTGHIMRETFMGRLVSAVSISMIIMMYAISQIAQMLIDYDKLNE